MDFSNSEKKAFQKMQADIRRKHASANYSEHTLYHILNNDNSHLNNLKNNFNSDDYAAINAALAANIVSGREDTVLNLEPANISSERDSMQAALAEQEINSPRSLEYVPKARRKKTQESSPVETVKNTYELVDSIKKNGSIVLAVLSVVFPLGIGVSSIPFILQDNSVDKQVEREEISKQEFKAENLDLEAIATQVITGVDTN